MIQIFSFLCYLIKFTLNFLEVLGLITVDPYFSICIDYVCENSNDIYIILKNIYLWLRSRF